MDSDAETHLLSTHHEKDSSEDATTVNDNSEKESRIQGLLGLLAAFAFVFCIAFSAIFVQVSDSIMKH